MSPSSTTSSAMPRQSRALLAGVLVGVLIVVGLWIVMRMNASPMVGPSVQLFAVVEPPEKEPGQTRSRRQLSGNTIRERDKVIVTVTGKEGTIITLIVLGSGNNLILDTDRNTTLPRQGFQTWFMADNIPGLEQFFVLATEEPVTDLSALVEAVNKKKVTRQERIQALRDALSQKLDGRPFTLKAGAEFNHVL